MFISRHERSRRLRHQTLERGMKRPRRCGSVAAVNVEQNPRASQRHREKEEEPIVRRNPERRNNNMNAHGLQAPQGHIPSCRDCAGDMQYIRLHFLEVAGVGEPIVSVGHRAQTRFGVRIQKNIQEPPPRLDRYISRHPCYFCRLSPRLPGTRFRHY